MRRSDREITEFDEMIKIIDGCDVLRLGLSDGNFPYIVPVNFAYELIDGQLLFYFHGAKAGRKYEMLQSSPYCSFELDIPLGIKLFPERKAVTMRYKSVMGTAHAEFLQGEEKQRGIDLLISRYPQTSHFDYNTASLQNTAVVKLTVTEISAKANLP